MEITDLSPEQIASRAEELQRDPVFRHAMDSLRDKTLQTMKELKGKQVAEESENLVRMIQVIDSFEKILTHHMNTGKLMKDRNMRLAK